MRAQFVTLNISKESVFDIYIYIERERYRFSSANSANCQFLLAEDQRIFLLADSQQKYLHIYQHLCWPTDQQTFGGYEQAEVITP